MLRWVVSSTARLNSGLIRRRGRGGMCEKEEFPSRDIEPHMYPMWLTVPFSVLHHCGHSRLSNNFHLHVRQVVMDLDHFCG